MHAASTNGARLAQKLWRWMSIHGAKFSMGDEISPWADHTSKINYDPWHVARKDPNDDADDSTWTSEEEDAEDWESDDPDND